MERTTDWVEVWQQLYWNAAAAMGELSYPEAVHLFEEWGFLVEPGPGADEVTLIVETPGSRNYGVHPAHMLPAMAAAVLAVRQRRVTAAACCAPDPVGTGTSGIDNVRDERATKKPAL